MRHDVMPAKELYEGSRGDILVATANVLDREEEVDGAMEHLKGVVLQVSLPPIVSSPPHATLLYRPRLKP
jgi:hypothetical protein